MTLVDLARVHQRKVDLVLVLLVADGRVAQVVVSVVRLGISRGIALSVGKLMVQVWGLGLIVTTVGKLDTWGVFVLSGSPARTRICDLGGAW